MVIILQTPKYVSFLLKFLSNFPYPGLNLGLSFFVTIPTIHLRKTLRDPNLSLSSSNFLYFVVPLIVRTHFSSYFLLFISLYFLLILSLYFLYFHFSFPFFSYFFFLFSSSTFARRTPLLVGFTSTTPFSLSHISFNFLSFSLFPNIISCCSLLFLLFISYSFILSPSSWKATIAPNSLLPLSAIDDIISFICITTLPSEPPSPHYNVVALLTVESLPPSFHGTTLDPPPVSPMAVMPATNNQQPTTIHTYAIALSQISPCSLSFISHLDLYNVCLLLILGLVPWIFCSTFDFGLIGCGLHCCGLWIGYFGICFIFFDYFGFGLNQF